MADGRGPLALAAAGLLIVLVQLGLALPIASLGRSIDFVPRPLPAEIGRRFGMLHAAFVLLDLIKASLLAFLALDPGAPALVQPTKEEHHLRIRTVILHLVLVALAGPGPRAVASEPPVAPGGGRAHGHPHTDALASRLRDPTQGRFGPETVAYGDRGRDVSARRQR